MIKKIIKRFYANPEPKRYSVPEVQRLQKPITRFSSEFPALAIHATANKPMISFIIIIYKMPEQAKKTLQSMSTNYQHGVHQQDYEVIVVENQSSDELGKEEVERFGKQFRYYHRKETDPSPVHAINFGVDQARADHVAIMIDGARMATPGLINYAAAALRLGPQVIICVPGYHLGRIPQQEAMLEGYDQTAEKLLLEAIDWPKDGYRLFDIACLSGTSGGGYYKPIGESNCLVMSKQVYQAVGGCNPHFNSHGGGMVNLDLYKRCCEHPDTLLVTLNGEGTFHQFHGGATTGNAGEQRETGVKEIHEQYLQLRGQRFSPPEKRALFFGPLHESALRFSIHSAEKVISVNQLKSHWAEHG
jgi:hypothetical protein